jgi:hypothetical protein
MWFTAAPGNNLGTPFDPIPYDENDEDVLKPTQTPERSRSPSSIFSSPESLASVPSTVPEGDPEE